MKYNPTVKIDTEKLRPVINFEHMYEWNEKNRRKLLEEIYELIKEDGKEVYLLKKQEVK